MLARNILFYLLFLHLINGQLQINLYLTDWVSNKEHSNGLLHNCLYATTNPPFPHREPYQIIPYCMGEWPSKWDIQENSIDQKFTFTELAEQSITSEQLYLWSAPIDIIESYQFYLNQQINSKTISLSKSIYYNCTLPNFGPKCQYALYDYKSHQSSLDQIVYEFYKYNEYVPTLLTCYIHLQCYRGPPPSCLDWTEICDGKVDCLDGEQDEKDCWQIEIHQCDENEFRCLDGQCIPLTFLRETEFHSDCLDQSDQSTFHILITPTYSYYPNEPSFGYEDISCVKLSNYFITSIASSCVGEREELLSHAMFSIKPKTIKSYECWTAVKCIIHVPIPFGKLCENLCLDGTCDRIVRNDCPDIVYAPADPVLLGHVFLAYEKNTLNYRSSGGSEPTYFCYDDQRLYLPNNIEKLVLSDNTTCRSYDDSILDEDDRETEWIDRYADPLYKWLKMWTSQIYNDSIHCNKSVMHQCADSYKCISKDRFYDGIQDCFHKEDEDMSKVDKNCSTKQNSNYFKCETTNECISRRFVNDGTCQCTIHTVHPKACDDEYFQNRNMKNEISFLIICDGFTHLFPKMIDNENHTDETECDQWPCNNIYTRCNKFWNCPNGVDELNCDLSPMMQCPPNNHICASVETKKMMCLSIEKANDGKVDCIGGTDEPALCRMGEYDQGPMSFYCRNETHWFCLWAGSICDGKAQCPKADDEQMCSDIGINEPEPLSCNRGYNIDYSRAANVFCKPFFSQAGDHFNAIYFKLGKDTQNSLKANVAHENSNVPSRQSTLSQTINLYQQRCHRGLELQVWLDKEKNLTTRTCLCPPSFYGDTCQYQNQRVSITIKFHLPSDSTGIPIVLINSLIDDTEQRTTHSYEQFTYLSKKYCEKKFNFYLLYSTRPKNATINYFVHIDMYEKKSLKYRGSIIKPILFSFLPVYRLAFEVNIPRMYSNIEICSDDQCINGQCRRYFNDLNNTFCHCNPGWSGQYCTIKHTCTCSSDSICIGILPNNQSICVCPLNKMGTQCLLNNTFLCQINSNETCLNGGQCIIINEHRTIYQQIICICQKGFTGDRCEITSTKIVLSFDNNITLSSSILIHFIEVIKLRIPSTSHTTHYKTIPYEQRSVTIYWSNTYHLVFIELTNKKYYLAILQKDYNKSAIIEKTLHPSDRCLNITELFNETILNYHLLRRIKHYHLPCRSNFTQHIQCFYDDIHLCLCQDHNHERVANCFEFNHHMKRNCADKNGCENDGDCFQDNSKCPTTSICVCPTCFYGPQCQLNSNGFSLSLDAILGYHIRPNINIRHQPISVIMSLILTVIITFIGIINGILTLITFKNKITRASGCGIYLLYSSIITLLTMITFLLKFLILLLSHMGLIKNRLFLDVQCHSIDFILRVCLTMDQWLTTCVAIERAYITIKGSNFNAKKTKLIAKWTVFVLLCIMAGTAIHDSIYRDLFDENIDEEKRIWCYVKYSSTIQTFNIVMNIFHFLIPFIINIISALIIIIMNTRQRARVQVQENYRELLNEQIEQHRNLLIGPTVLIILGIPRLIISHTSGCMKSPSDAWLFLLGYFISLTPPILTFILFVLPSTIYKKAFLKTINQYRNRFTSGS